MAKFKNENEKELALLFLVLWNKLPNIITLNDIEEAIIYEDLSIEQKERLQEVYDKFTLAFLYAILEKSINENIDKVANEIDISKIQINKEEIDKWIRNKTSSISRYYSNSQIGSIQEAIRLTYGIDDKHRSKLIHSIIGLDEASAKNAINYYKKLTEKEIIDSRREELLNDYVERSKDNRATNSGISEYNWSDVAASLYIAQAVARYDQDMILTKTWITKGDSKVCTHCRQVSGMTIPIDAYFPIYGGIESPADSHNRCRCKLKYKRVDKRVFSNDKWYNISGGTITDTYSVKATSHAELYYKEIRKQTTDISRIAKNTGYSQEFIKEIKQYLFFEKHKLGNEIKRFDPDFTIAQSWQRLAQGGIEPHDLTLLKHEEMERKLIRYGLTQDEAHKLTSQKYNYQKEAEKYYDSLKKRKNKK